MTSLFFHVIIHNRTSKQQVQFAAWNKNQIERGEGIMKYVCDVCGYIYDEAIGDPDNGVAAGTLFADLPEDWVCPLCSVGTDEFSPAE